MNLSRLSNGCALGIACLALALGGDALGDESGAEQDGWITYRLQVLDRSADRDGQALVDRLSGLIRDAHPMLTFVVEFEGDTLVVKSASQVDDLIDSLAAAPGWLQMRLVCIGADGRPLISESAEGVLALAGGEMPEDSELVTDSPAAGSGEAWLCVRRQNVIDGRHLVSARAVEEPSGGHPRIRITLSIAGGEVMQAFTRQNIGRMMALLAGNRCIMYATIQDEAGAEIDVIHTGSPEQARDLARSMLSALPPIVLISREPPLP